LHGSVTSVARHLPSCRRSRRSNLTVNDLVVLSRCETGPKRRALHRVNGIGTSDTRREANKLTAIVRLEFVPFWRVNLFSAGGVITNGFKRRAYFTLALRYRMSGT